MARNEVGRWRAGSETCSQKPQGTRNIIKTNIHVGSRNDVKKHPISWSKGIVVCVINFKVFQP